jgi:hypothetical protein
VNAIPTLNCKAADRARCFYLIALTLAFALPRAAACRGFEFADLQALIETRHISSIEELLPELPLSFRSRYALMFTSRSLQGATFDAPRAILYGPDARFVITFNGNADQRGYHTLETMEFDDVTRQFQFREVAFTASPDDAPASVRVSAPNPARCVACHGSRARPVWDGQPLWPGAYGERYNAKLSAEETAGMDRFLARQAADPRYQHLLGAGRFRSAELFRPSTQTLYAGTLSEPPNAELSALLDRLVSQAIARQLAQDPRFEAFQYVLLGMSDGNCGGFEEFYPRDRGRAVRTLFSSYLAAADQQNARLAAAKATRLTAGNQTQAVIPQRTSATGASVVRFIAERELNLLDIGWTPTLEKGAFESAPLGNARNSLRDALLAEVARHDPKIKELGAYATSSDGDRYCKYLKRQSRSNLSAPMPAL